MSDFPCTKCGACCKIVRGHALTLFREKGWITPEGSCTNYDPQTKECKIYSSRPTVCRVDLLPISVDDDVWHAYVAKHCDASHMAVYGVPRERGVVCDHVELGPTMQLQMETVSTCNARCHFCVYPTAGRKGGVMDWGLFRKIVNETASMPIVNVYVLHGLGEPLLDPHLKERVSYIKWLKPKADVEIYTNGLALNPERFDALRDAGVTSIVISLNAVRQEQHERIMGMRGKFDQICSNIDYAISHKGDMSLQVHAVANEDVFTRDDARSFYKRWGHRNEGGYAHCVIEGNWAGDNRTMHGFDPKATCMRALSQIYVMYDGRVSMCCFDPTGKTIFGDLKTQSLREIYSSDPYLKFRTAHWEKRADEYASCSTCTRI